MERDLKSGKGIAVWAINPFEQETRPCAAVVEELRGWLEATGYRLQPVHVLHAPSADVQVDSRGAWLETYIPAVEKEISNYLAGMKLPRVERPRVLLQHEGSTAAAVKVLVDYAADELGAQWILVSSKGRSGLRRMALGSFAESLLIHSPVPVWVFGHGTPAALDAKRIVFSTDFSKASKEAFEMVIDQAAALGSSVTLIHCLNLPDTLVSGAGMMGAASYFPADDYLKDQAALARAEAEILIAAAAKRGVKAELVVQEIVPNIAGAIVAEAGRVHAGVIALASRSGTVGATLLGSHARQIVRASECPVWVYGPAAGGRVP